MMIRVVTSEEVGVLSAHLFRRRAEAVRRRFADPHGSVEYYVVRRGWRWLVIAYQARLVREEAPDGR